MIVIERKGAIEAIGASKDLLAKTWGKQIVSGLGYGLIGFLLTIPAIMIVVSQLAPSPRASGMRAASTCERLRARSPCWRFSTWSRSAS